MASRARRASLDMPHRIDLLLGAAKRPRTDPKSRDSTSGKLGQDQGLAAWLKTDPKASQEIKCSGHDPCGLAGNCRRLDKLKHEDFVDFTPTDWTGDDCPDSSKRSTRTAAPHDNTRTAALGTRTACSGQDRRRKMLGFARTGGHSSLTVQTFVDHSAIEHDHCHEFIVIAWKSRRRTGDS